MTALTADLVEQIDDSTTRTSIPEIAAYLRDQLGQRVTAYLVGAADPKQIAGYVRGARISDLRARRLREGYKVVRMIEAVYSVETAKVWLFGTNSRLDDQAPIEVIGGARETVQFADVHRAARQFASADA